jgi:hypothetical protein
MTERDEQLDRLREAVDRKSEAAEEASRNPGRNPTGDDVTLGPTGDVQPGLKSDGPQETLDERAKNEGHGKKTADKWNQ